MRFFCSFSWGTLLKNPMRTSLIRERLVSGGMCDRYLWMCAQMIGVVGLPGPSGHVCCKMVASAMDTACSSLASMLLR